MDALVTGGTGFVGANLVRELLADGRTVRVLARPESDRRALEGCRVEIAEGDLLDRDSLRAAVAGARRVYHVAADYRLWARDSRELYRANVDGTRHVLEAAVEAGAERIVYTSTVGALGIPRDGTPGDETTPVGLEDMVGPYKASKFLAERVADELAARGAPVVIVNPSAPVGPWDIKPTPTGQMIVDFLKGKMVGSLDTGLNIVHVRDVALASFTGVRAPRFRVPYSVAWLAAFCMESAARVTGGAPEVALDAVRMARKRMYFSAAKAVRELGLPQTPAEDALRDAVTWFVERGYAPRPAKAA